MNTHIGKHVLSSDGRQIWVFTEVKVALPHCECKIYLKYEK